MPHKAIVIPTKIGGRRRIRRSPPKLSRPTELTMNDGTLVFKRKSRPRCLWLVPPITVPLYWFDIVMLRKKLLTRIGDDLFVVDGRRFRVIRQEQHIVGTGYTRWLVYEENVNLPDKGHP